MDLNPLRLPPPVIGKRDTGNDKPTPPRIGFRQSLHIVVVIALFVRPRDHISLVLLGVENDLAVDGLRRTSYIDRRIRYILPLKRRTIPENSQPVTILTSDGGNVDNRQGTIETMATVTMPQSGEDPADPATLKIQRTIPPMT